jgi:hypothetical protein
MDNTANVRITGDASGAVLASKEAAAAWERAGVIMREAFIKLGIVSRESFAVVGNSALESAAKVTAASAEVVAATKVEAAAVQSSSVAMRASFFAVGVAVATSAAAAVAGAVAIAASVASTMRMTSENQKLATALGITLRQASGTAVTLRHLGISTDDVTKAAAKIVPQLAKNEAGFKAMGIATRDSAGHFRSLQDIMVDGIAKINGYKAGVDRTGAANVIFGKGVGDITELLALNSEELAKGAKSAQSFGLVTTEAAVAAQSALKDKLDGAVNVLKDSMAGLGVVISNAVAPAIISLAEWVSANAVPIFNSLKAYVEVCTESFRLWASVLGVVWDVAASVFHAVGDLINQLVGGTVAPQSRSWQDHFHAIIVVVKAVGAAIVTFVEVAAGTINSLIGILVTFARVAYDAFRLDWGSIEADWTNGMAALEAASARGAANIRAQWAGVISARNAALAPTVSTSFGDKSIASIEATLAPKPAQSFGGGGHLDNLSPGHAGPKAHHSAKAPKGSAGPTNMDKWSTELTDGLLAEEKAGRDIIAFTVDFWQKKLALTKTGTREQLEVRRNLTRAEIAAARESNQNEITAIRQLQTLHLDAAQTDMELARLVVAEKLELVDTELARGRISAKQAAQQRAALNAELYEMDAGLERRLFKIKLDALKSELAIYKVGTKQYADYLRAIELLEAQHNQKMQVLDANANAKKKSDSAKVVDAQRAGFQGIAQSWAQSLAKMATFQQGFETTIKQIWGSIVGAFQSAIARMVEQWILSLLIKETTSKAFNAKQILMDAKSAAAGAWRAVVGIPVIGPVLAPVAAAAAFAGVMAFSAEGGYDVPASVGAGIDGRGGQMGIVHPREMVLPADIADQFRNGGSGGMTVNIHATDADSVKRLFSNNKAALAAALKNAFRDGVR